MSATTFTISSRKSVLCIKDWLCSIFCKKNACQVYASAMLIVAMLFIPSQCFSLVKNNQIAVAQRLTLHTIDEMTPLSDVTLIFDSEDLSGGGTGQAVQQSLPSADTIHLPVVYLQNNAKQNNLTSSWHSITIVLMVVVALLFIGGLIATHFYSKHSKHDNQRLLEEIENLKTMQVNKNNLNSSDKSSSSNMQQEANASEQLSATAIDRHNALSNDEMFLQSVNQLIEEDITLASNVEKLAEKLNMTTQTFRRHIKSATGQLPKAYLSSLRMTEAKKMLEHTDFSLVEIADICGFTDASNFTRTFRRDFKTTPSAYRAQQRRSHKEMRRKNNR